MALPTSLAGGLLSLPSGQWALSPYPSVSPRFPTEQVFVQHLQVAGCWERRWSAWMWSAAPQAAQGSAEEQDQALRVLTIPLSEPLAL